MQTDSMISFHILKNAFPGMQEDEAREMIKAGTLIDLPAGSIICAEGSIGATFYIILKGEVEVTKQINQAEVRVLNHLRDGEFFGEMALIHEAPRVATVTTTMPTTMLEIGKEAFTKMLQSSGALSLAIVREISRRLRSNDEMAIEDLRKKARELSRAYQQLSDLEKARSDFLTTIAHELRTPLMAASGFVQLIQMGNLQGDALHSALDTISHNLKEIVSLTNDILFLQEMDLILPQFQPTDVGAVVASAVEEQRSHALQNKVGLRFNIAPGLPVIQADSKSLQRAITAILDNAIKFSPNGGDVYIDVSSTKSQITIRIQDSGVGIAEDVLPHIFERFFHVDQVEGHLFRGAGLGLSIALQVLELHHGMIEVKSKLGKGSTFTIRLNLVL
jgi:signal transduction histidine kinase